MRVIIFNLIYIFFFSTINYIVNMSNKIVALNVGAIKVKRFEAYNSGDTIKFQSNLNVLET